jgi:hypothetical protein
MFFSRLRVVGSGLLMVLITLFSETLSRIGFSRQALSTIRVGSRFSRGHESLFYSQLAAIYERAGDIGEAVRSLVRRFRENTTKRLWRFITSNWEPSTKRARNMIWLLSTSSSPVSWVRGLALNSRQI